MKEENLQKEIEDLQNQAREISALEAKEKADSDKKRNRLAIKKQVKNKVILYLSIIGGLFLVWQKLHIWIVIPGKFWHLFLIVGAIIGGIYFLLSKITED